MSKERRPLGLRPRKPLASVKSPQEKVEKPISTTATTNTKAKAVVAPPKKGRPSTKKGKKLVKYSMDIHPELKRAVVKAAAIYDKDVHVMWNEIIFSWFEKEQKKHPEWYKRIKVDKSEL